LAGDLRIRFLDVGQGDAIVGILPGGRRAFVVDVCNADRVLDFLEAEEITEIVLFLTHSDRDHTRGAQDLLAALTEQALANVLAIFFSRDRLTASRGSEYCRLLQFIGRIERRLSRNDPRNPSADFNTLLNQLPAFAALFPPVRVIVVHPAKADQDSLNGVSTNETAGVLLIEHPPSHGATRRVLLTSDVQLTGISLLMDRAGSQPIQAHVVKYPHHGAWPTTWPGMKGLREEIPRRTMAEFLNQVMPSTVVFSVGGDNDDGHVRREVIELLTTYHRDFGRLRNVKWTQITKPCLEPGTLPSAGPLAEPAGAGDIEIGLGDYPNQDFVRVLCSAKGEC
jgi:hypothetical protein